MNDPHESLSDELLDELLAPLRAAPVPGNVCKANREAVQQALERRVQPHWWRRTVAVPLPFAVAAMLMMAFTVAALLWPGERTQTVDGERTRPTQAAVLDGDAAEVVDRVHQLRPTWSVTRSYIQSLESLANVRVSLDSLTQEKSDES
jgi:hypothetical protein